MKLQQLRYFCKIASRYPSASDAVEGLRSRRVMVEVRTAILHAIVHPSSVSQCDPQDEQKTPSASTDAYAKGSVRAERATCARSKHERHLRSLSGRTENTECIHRRLREGFRSC